MSVWMDYLIAFIVAAAIIFIIAGMQLRGQTSSISAVQYNVAKSDLRLLVDMIEQDFTNMGAGVENPNASAADAVITQAGVSGSEHVLRFYGLPGMISPPEPQVIEYRWRQDGQVRMKDGTTVDTWVVERWVDGTKTGSSFSNLTKFSIELLRSNYTAFNPGVDTDYESIRYLNVSIAMVSHLGPDRVVQETQWSRQYRPINLDADSRALVRVVLPVP